MLVNQKHVCARSIAQLTILMAWLVKNVAQINASEKDFKFQHAATIRRFVNASMTAHWIQICLRLDSLVPIAVQVIAHHKTNYLCRVREVAVRQFVIVNMTAHWVQICHQQV